MELNLTVDQCDQSTKAQMHQCLSERLLSELQLTHVEHMSDLDRKRWFEQTNVWLRKLKRKTTNLKSIRIFMFSAGAASKKAVRVQIVWTQSP